MKDKRVSFVFDERSLRNIQALKDQGKLGPGELPGEVIAAMWESVKKLPPRPTFRQNGQTYYYVPLRLRKTYGLDSCQWADGQIGRVVQQTINMEDA